LTKLSGKPGLIAEILESLKPHLAELYLEELGYIFERFLNSEEANKNGVFYTSPELARYLVRDAVDAYIRRNSGISAESFSLLDPACGAGIFLLEGYKYLRELCAESPET